MMRDMEMERKAVNKWHLLEIKCRAEDIPFDLTVTELRSILIKKVCFYSGTRFGETPQDCLTLDKIVPELGYVRGNVVACTSRVNKAKGDLSFREIENMYNKIIELNKEKT